MEIAINYLEMVTVDKQNEKIKGKLMKIVE